MGFLQLCGTGAVLYLRCYRHVGKTPAVILADAKLYTSLSTFNKLVISVRKVLPGMGRIRDRYCRLQSSPTNGVEG